MIGPFEIARYTGWTKGGPRMNAEQFRRDLAALHADTMELQRETLRLHGEPWWKPMALGAGLFLAAFVLALIVARLPIW